ncbi:Fatty acyl-CoA reductase, partial [Theobroma cacao]
MKNKKSTECAKIEQENQGTGWKSHTHLLCFFLHKKKRKEKVLYLVNILNCQYFRQVYMDLNRKIKLVMRFAEVYKPYAFFKGIFSDSNLDKLQMVAQGRGVDMGVFDFDSK